MITLRAPASRCLAASSRLVNRPVDSITTSAPRSAHGSAAGSRSASTLTSLPSTTRVSSRTSTVPGYGPRTESYLSRWPRVLASVRSLTPTHSMSALRSCAARNTLRPMRPKPLIPTRTDMPEAPRSPYESARRLAGGLRPRRGAIDVAVLDLDEVAIVGSEVRCEVLRDDDRSVAAARAPDRHDQVGPALADVLRQQVVEQRDRAAVELVEPAVAGDVVDDPRVEAGQHAELRLVVRVGQEAHVEGEVSVARRPVLVPEGREGDREPSRRLRLEQLVGDLAPQHRRAQPARVDDRVGELADRRERLGLAADAVDQVARGRERVAPARLLVPAEERLVVGAEVDHAVRDLVRAQRLDHPREAAEELAAALVGDDGRPLDLRAVVHEQPRQRPDHLGRQVVDAEVARVLEDVHRGRLARAGLPGDDHEVDEVRARRRGAVTAHGLIMAYRPVRLRWAKSSRATFWGTPGTDSSASRGADSTASGEPKCLSSARLRAGPMPGRSSMIDSVIALSRRIRWWVIAKRWASSRTRWSSCSSGVSWARRSGSERPGKKTSSIRLASEITATPRSRKPRSGSSPADSWPGPPSITTRFGSAANEASRSAS